MVKKKKKLVPLVVITGGKNRVAEAHKILVKLFKEGVKIEEIVKTLTDAGYRTNAGTEFNSKNVKAYLKVQRYKVEPKPIYRPPALLDVSNNGCPLKEKVSEKPSVIKLAAKVITVRHDKDGKLFYRINGKWVSANVAEIVRAANKILHKRNEPQIDINPNWIVK